MYRILCMYKIAEWNGKIYVWNHHFFRNVSIKILIFIRMNNIKFVRFFLIPRRILMNRNSILKPWADCIVTVCVAHSPWKGDRTNESSTNTLWTFFCRFYKKKIVNSLFASHSLICIFLFCWWRIEESLFCSHRNMHNKVL